MMLLPLQGASVMAFAYPRVLPWDCKLTGLSALFVRFYQRRFPLLHLCDAHGGLARILADLAAHHDVGDGRSHED